MESWKQDLHLAYLKLKKTSHQETFLHKCITRDCIPKGLQLNVNICVGGCAPSALYKMNKSLVSAGRDILKIVHDEVKCSIQDRIHQINILKEKGIHNFGHVVVNRAVKQAKQQSEKKYRTIPQSHDKKLAKLIRMSDPPFTPEKINKGSIRVLGFPTKTPSNTVNTHETQQRLQDPSTCFHKPTHRGKRSQSQRKSRKIARQKRERHLDYRPTEEELSRFDPIVLVDNYTPTTEQIEILRMSKATAPTPKEPVDVSDQLIGFHRFAERMRWHRHFEMEKRAAENKGDPDQQPEENFIKRPWYKPTTKAAPKTNPELESFLAACERDFLDIKNRRRIKDNMTSGQRKAIKELRELPITHGAACRYADKSAATVITSLKEDDRIIEQAITDPRHFDVLVDDPTPNVIGKIKNWAQKWQSKTAITEEMAQYTTNIDDAHPARCKPLIKTHKNKPYPYRLLLSGSGTPVQPLSKWVQQAIAHLTTTLPFQVIDTKEFLRKIQTINLTMTPLPASACLAVCDVISLYPSVDNTMGVPAVKMQLDKFPSPLNIPKKCILEALTIALENTNCHYTDGEGMSIHAAPNSGTAMGPCHACDYVDVFMGQLDEKLVTESPVPLLSSLQEQQGMLEDTTLSWSRYRDDGFAILPNGDKAEEFENFLQTLHPGIQWTVSCGKRKEYLDLSITITEDGKLETDVFSKNSNSYLPPFSCHAPSVFRGVAMGIGTRLRMLVSNNDTLQERVKEYAKYLTMSGWSWKRALREIRQGASRDREDLLKEKPQKQKKKIAWITTHDPRLPPKTAIIKSHLHLLHANPDNVDIFPKGMVVAADKKRRNLAEMYMPTIPKRTKPIIPDEPPGFFPCFKCDTCRHSEKTKGFRSPWDGRRWQIRQHITCRTKAVIYLLRCRIHPDLWYVGSTKDLRRRWAGHKSDVKLKRTSRCKMAEHVHTCHHPQDPQFGFLYIVPIEAVKREDDLLSRETYWQANLGTLFTGLNCRSDLNTVLHHRIQY